MLCSKPHCQKGSNLMLFSYTILATWSKRTESAATNCSAAERMRAMSPHSPAPLDFTGKEFQSESFWQLSLLHSMIFISNSKAFV